MNIGFDAKRLFANGRGLGNYSRSTVRLLARYAPEHRYVLFTPHRDDLYGFGDALPVVGPGGLWRAAPSLWRSYAMGAALRREGIDLYHGLCHEVPADVWRCGVRSVVTMHDLIFVRRPELYRPFDRWCFCRKYSRSCRMADAVVAISKQTAADLIELWHIPEEKIEVIYQGCDERFARPVEPGRMEEVRRRWHLPEAFILSVGAIEERKNLLLTLRALAEAGVEGEVVACGAPTPYADRLLDYATRHGIAHRLHLLHGVPTDDLPALYRMARVMVYTSRYEGFGIPILEALNAGVPVVTTRGGVFAETGGDACLYVDPDSVEEMAEALGQAMGDEQVRCTLIDRGYRHAARFAEPLIARRLSDLYARIG